MTAEAKQILLSRKGRISCSQAPRATPPRPKGCGSIWRQSSGMHVSPTHYPQGEVFSFSILRSSKHPC
jgi:hypothetical protein